ncbi:MAG: hypothetical protein M5U01_23025 [Ardenticatenaceae bacterium]|nr:hypothetical protein [Ardenticatenaceae bacterium]HBY92650.1 hypothetical protein [Chloroflexota bacterium]
MTREELLALCEKAPAIGQVKHTEFVDYIVVLEQARRGSNGQWEKVETAYMSVDGRVAMANEDHRRQDKALNFEDPVVLVDDEEQLTLLVAVSSEIYGRRHGIATSRKIAGTSAEKNFPWEVAETSAIGRALGAMGYGILPGSGLASADDVQRAQEAPERGDRGRRQPATNGLARSAAERRTRPVSPFQRQKLHELYEELFPGQPAETGLDELFLDQVGHSIDEASYDEGRQVTAYLLREKRAPEVAATN